MSNILKTSFTILLIIVFTSKVFGTAQYSDNIDSFLRSAIINYTSKILIE